MTALHIGAFMFTKLAPLFRTDEQMLELHGLKLSYQGFISDSKSGKKKKKKKKQSFI